MRRLAKIGASGVILASALLALSAVADAQTQQPKAPAAPAKAAPAAPQRSGWSVNCINIPAGLDCRAVQTLRLDPTGRITLGVGVRIPADTKKTVLLFQTPHGIYLPAGVTVQIGQDAAKAIPFQTCAAAGCLAEYPISGAELAAMENGTELTVSMQDLNKKSFKMRVPTLGFAEAYAKIK
jgi:invasion protein IalB